MRAHPASADIGVTKSALWYGYEVEGRLAKPRVAAPMTAFIDWPPSAEDLTELRRRISVHNVRHVFLTENFEDFEWFQAQVLPYLPESFRITIGVEPDDEEIQRLLELPFADRMTLMVRAAMQAPWITRLRGDDQVSVGEPYNLATFVVRDAVFTAPADYADDQKP